MTLKNLKIQLVTAVFLVCAFSCFAQSESFSVSAGLNTARYEGKDFDFTKGLGFYVSANLENMLTKKIGYGGGLQLTDYRYQTEKYVNNISLEPFFYLKVVPQDGLSLLGGFQVMEVIQVRYDGEKQDVPRASEIFWTAGVAYDISDRLGLTYRYNGGLTDALRFSMQLGLSYKFSGKEE